MEVLIHTFLNLALDRHEWLALQHSYFTPSTNCWTAGWVGLIADMDAFSRRDISFFHKLNHDSLAIQPTAQSLIPLSYPRSLSAQPFLHSKQLPSKSRKLRLFDEHEVSFCFPQTLQLVPTLSRNNPLNITPYPQCMVTVSSHLCLGLPKGL